MPKGVVILKKSKVDCIGLAPAGTVTKKLLNEPFLKPSEAALARDIPATLEAICCKALEKEARNRYHDVNEMIEELQNYRDGKST